MPKRSALLLILAGILAGAATVPSTTSRPATAPASAPATKPATTSAPAFKSAKDGIYNDAQLARGKKAYLASCARCHGDTLGGNDDAVALVGNDFLNDWAGKSVGDLEEYTRANMPSDGPGKLSRAEVTDIVVFILNQNSFPAGKNELPADVDVMKAIPIQVKK